MRVEKWEYEEEEKHFPNKMMKKCEKKVLPINYQRKLSWKLGDILKEVWKGGGQVKGWLVKCGQQ